ncbi:MAG: methyltransferase domain-containing protein [Chloroflexi bacterium]|nr:methyltransferase domain-containing protein [Chloroflexota bacterium]
MSGLDYSGNAERFSGFAAQYEAVRPSPPPILREILPALAQVKRPTLVVDLGSGTGLSTRFWQAHADRVVGIEVSDDMRREAQAQTNASNVEYRAGVAHDTGLPDHCADIVTCSQSFHWMAPQPTLQEVARILRRGGVFAAYDCDWPPATTSWQADAAWDEMMERVRNIERDLKLRAAVHQWRKQEHIANLRASGHFRFVREIVLHHVEPGNAERIVGIALSQGGTRTVLKHGLSEDEIGITALREICARTLGDELKPWYWSYRVRIGIV